MTPQEIEALIVEGLTDKVEALSTMVELLKAERDALAAKLDKIGNAWFAAGSWPDTAEEMKEISAALLSDPQQCLRDVQAEAGWKGFIAGYDAGHEYRFSGMGDELADEYAATVRRGGAE